MTAADVPPNYAVTCRTCDTCVWQSDDHPGPDHDGQVIATRWADVTCRRPDCPHTSAAIEQARLAAPVPRSEMEAMQTRIAQLEELIRGAS